MLLFGYSAAGQAGELVFFDIPEQRADLALTEFAQQANISVLFPFDEISRLSANRLVGEYDIANGLRVLLDGTGLTTTVEERRQFIVRVSSNEGGEAEMSRRQGFFAALAAAFMVGGGAGSASGQESQAATTLLEEVVVTARRREENLQQVPVSIEAYSAAEMEIRGIERVEDAVAQTPNVFVVGGPSGNSDSSAFAMRGIPDVGFFVDGIWQQNSDLLMNRSTLELERVEMLRGPQGTLYGRDTTGGAIRLYSRRPAEEFGMRMTATLGSYDRQDISANVDIPITDTFLTKFTVAREQRDGYLQSLIVDRAYGERDDEFARADLLWTPSDRLTFRLILEDALQQTTEASAAIVVVDPGDPGPGPGLGFVVPPRQYYELAGFTWNNQSHASGFPGGEVGKWETKSAFNLGHGTFVDAEARTLSVEWDITDYVTMTSLTGWRNTYSMYGSDFGAAEFEFFSQQGWDNDDSLTQEFQFTGGQDRINWVGGLYYSKTDQQGRSLRWSLTDLDLNAIRATPECQVQIPGLTGCIPLPNTDNFNGSKQELYAIFGEVTFNLTDTLSLTVGARYHDQDNTNWDEIFAPSTPRRRDTTEHRQILPGDYFASAGRENFRFNSFDADTYRLALTNQFNENLMVYFGYAEGFNSGGVNRERVPDLNGVIHTLLIPFDSEIIETTEIGVRSDLLDGRLRLNATYFQTDWVGLQQGLEVRNPFTGQLIPSTLTQNVGDAEANGAEFTVTGQATNVFSFDVGVGILDTGYVSLLPGVQAVSIGDKFGRAPELQYSLAGQWDLPMGNGGEVTLRLDYNWTDDYIRSYSPDTQLQSLVEGAQQFDQEAFGLLNARVVYRPPDGQWEVSAFGTNLTDEWYLNGGFSPAILGKDQSRIGRPREAGVSLKVFFE